MVYIGEPVSFRKYVTVTDNVDKDVELEVDSSSVNLTKAGSYTVVYRVVDSSGNAAEKSAVYRGRKAAADHRAGKGE